MNSRMRAGEDPTAYTAFRRVFSRALGRARRSDPPARPVEAGFAAGLDETERAALETVPAADRRTLEQAMPHTMTAVVMNQISST